MCVRVFKVRYRRFLLHRGYQQIDRPTFAIVLKILLYSDYRETRTYIELLSRRLFSFNYQVIFHQIIVLLLSILFLHTRSIYTCMHILRRDCKVHLRIGKSRRGGFKKNLNNRWLRLWKGERCGPLTKRFLRFFSTFILYEKTVTKSLKRTPGEQQDEAKEEGEVGRKEKRTAMTKSLGSIQGRKLAAFVSVVSS